MPTITDIDFDQVKPWFDNADSIETEIHAPGFRLVKSAGKTVGAVFISSDISAIPAYSGSPIATLIGINPAAKIVGLSIIKHQEPILVVGIKESDLLHYTEQYRGLLSSNKVRVNAGDRPGYTSVDGITGATITAMVLNRTIMISTGNVARALDWPKNSGASQQENVVSQNSFSANIHLWKENRLKVITLGAALTTLFLILFFQDWLVKKPRLFRISRNIFLIYTVIIIGYTFQAQLSIVNILAFMQTFMHGFTWETLLLDPALFLLWSFLAATILLWGRGVFCGWLCPFGAMQELIHSLAAKFNFPSFEFPNAVHERLWAIKYLILLTLIGVSLESFPLAATLAEVEPFKTVFTLHFFRDWAYVAYALCLLGISAFNSKFYCKYLCALGAFLSIPSKFHIFDWLRRRSQCGDPCQACASGCQINAISPRGHIIENECHYCLECQVTYWDDHTCPPLVEKRKRKEKRQKKADPTSIIASSNSPQA